MNISTTNGLSNTWILISRPKELASLLTSTGLETGSVEEVDPIRGGLRGLVMGRVLTCEPHPTATTFTSQPSTSARQRPSRWCAGTPKIAAGRTVVVATVGTTLYDGDKRIPDQTDQEDPRR